MRISIILLLAIFLTGCDEPEPNVKGKIVHVQIVEDGEGTKRESQSRYSLLWDDYTVVQLSDGRRKLLPGVWGEVGDEFTVTSRSWKYSP